MPCVVLAMIYIVAHSGWTKLQIRIQEFSRRSWSSYLEAELLASGLTSGAAVLGGDHLEAESATAWRRQGGGHRPDRWREDRRSEAVRPGGEEGENDARVRTAESRTRRRRRFQAEPPQSPSRSHRRRRAVTRRFQSDGWRRGEVGWVIRLGLGRFGPKWATMRKGLLKIYGENSAATT
jgi:hypothetical protein